METFVSPRRLSVPRRTAPPRDRGFSLVPRGFFFAALLGPFALASCAASPPAQNATPSPAPPVIDVRASPPEVLIHGNRSAGGTRGALVPGQLARVVRTSYPALRKCYEQALARDPNAAGRITIRYLIDRRGDVIDAQTTQTGKLPPEVASCVERVFRGLKFEAHSGGITTVISPINFVAGP